MKTMTELTQKESDILERAEDVIQRQVEILAKMGGKMNDADCRCLQTLVCTLGRARAVKGGNNFSNLPGLKGGSRRENPFTQIAWTFNARIVPISTAGRMVVHIIGKSLWIVMPRPNSRIIAEQKTIAI